MRFNHLAAEAIYEQMLRRDPHEQRVPVITNHGMTCSFYVSYQPAWQRWTIRYGAHTRQMPEPMELVYDNATTRRHRCLISTILEALFDDQGTTPEMTIRVLPNDDLVPDRYQFDVYYRGEWRCVTATLQRNLTFNTVAITRPNFERTVILPVQTGDEMREALVRAMPHLYPGPTREELGQGMADAIDQGVRDAVAHNANRPTATTPDIWPDLDTQRFVRTILPDPDTVQDEGAQLLPPGREPPKLGFTFNCHWRPNNENI